MQAEEEESKLVSDALGAPGLVNYLQLEPKLTEVDLSPYLFLAPTSLNREHITAVQPVDEKTRTLVRYIEGDDPIRQKTAAKQAAAAEPAVSAAVIRQLLADVSLARDATVATRILNGLVPICRKNPENYANVLKTLSQITLGGDGIAVAAVTLISEAEKSGVTGLNDLKQKYVQASPLAAALVGGGRERRQRRSGG